MEPSVALKYLALMSEPNLHMLEPTHFPESSAMKQVLCAFDMP